MKTLANDFAFSDSITQMSSVSKDNVEALHQPLTKREYFAAMAMQGILASSVVTVSSLDDNQKAMYATIMADNLITELNKEV